MVSPRFFSARPGSYLSITRTWKPGDRVSVQLPMTLRAEPMRDDPNLQAFLYGPVLLAGLLPGTVPASLVEGHAGPDFKKAQRIPTPVLRPGAPRLESWIHQTSAPLRFDAESAERVALLPFWKTDRARYSVYFRTT